MAPKARNCCCTETNQRIPNPFDLDDTPSIPDTLPKIRFTYDRAPPEQKDSRKMVWTKYAPRSLYSKKPFKGEDLLKAQQIVEELKEHNMRRLYFRTELLRKRPLGAYYVYIRPKNPLVRRKEFQNQIRKLFSNKCIYFENLMGPNENESSAGEIIKEESSFDGNQKGSNPKIGQFQVMHCKNHTEYFKESKFGNILSESESMYLENLKSSTVLKSLFYSNQKLLNIYDPRVILPFLHPNILTSNRFIKKSISKNEFNNLDEKEKGINYRPKLKRKFPPKFIVTEIPGNIVPEINFSSQGFFGGFKERLGSDEDDDEDEINGEEDDIKTEEEIRKGVVFTIPESYLQASAKFHPKTLFKNYTYMKPIFEERKRKKNKEVLKEDKEAGSRIGKESVQKVVKTFSETNIPSSIPIRKDSKEITILTDRMYHSILRKRKKKSITPPVISGISFKSKTVSEKLENKDMAKLNKLLRRLLPKETFGKSLRREILKRKSMLNIGKQNRKENLDFYKSVGKKEYQQLNNLLHRLQSKINVRNKTVLERENAHDNLWQLLDLSNYSDYLNDEIEQDNITRKFELLKNKEILKNERKMLVSKIFGNNFMKHCKNNGNCDDQKIIEVTGKSNLKELINKYGLDTTFLMDGWEKGCKTFLVEIGKNEMKKVLEEYKEKLLNEEKTDSNRKLTSLEISNRFSQIEKGNVLDKPNLKHRSKLTQLFPSKTEIPKQKKKTEFVDAVDKEQHRNVETKFQEDNYLVWDKTYKPYCMFTKKIRPGKLILEENQKLKEKNQRESEEKTSKKRLSVVSEGRMKTSKADVENNSEDGAIKRELIKNTSGVTLLKDKNVLYIDPGKFKIDGIISVLKKEKSGIIKEPEENSVDNLNVKKLSKKKEVKRLRKKGYKFVEPDPVLIPLEGFTETIQTNVKEYGLNPTNICSRNRKTAKPTAYWALMH